MKIVSFLLVFATGMAFSQTSSTHRITVFYFGSSDCPYCVDGKNIANINVMRTELPKKHAPTPFKFVMVVMDDSLDRGFRFAGKYVPWDEISIGQFYNNELMLEHVNRSRIPGVPHIMVYSDSLGMDTSGIPSMRKRTPLLDLVGESAIGKWIKNGFLIQE